MKILQKHKVKSNELDRWIVANEKSFTEAKQKGLYKGLISLAAKKKLLLSPTHISDLVWMVGDAIEKRVFDWYEDGGGEAELKEYYYSNLESSLYELEDLLLYHFFNEDGSFRNGDADLFRQLNLIRKIVAFPPLVEKYYVSYLKKEDEYYLKSQICDLCGTRGANCSYGGDQKFFVHEDCPAKYGFYKCEWCGWLYPNNKKKCYRKGRCGEKELVKCKFKDDNL